MEERAVVNSSPLWGKPREGAGKHGLVSGNVVSLDAPGAHPHPRATPTSYTHQLDVHGPLHWGGLTVLLLISGSTLGRRFCQPLFQKTMT